MLHTDYSPDGEKIRRILILNLKKALNRTLKMGDEMTKVLKTGMFTFSFVEAFDGELLSDAEKNRRLSLPGGYRYGELFKPGEIGCTMSHIKALMMAEFYNWDEVIIFEDDVVLADDFEKRIKILFNILPPDWEHVYLSGIPRGFSSPQLFFPNVEKSPIIDCIPAQVIRKSAYRKIFSYLSTFETTTDDMIIEMIHKQKSLVSYTYYPFCVKVEDDFTYIWNHELNRTHKSKQWFVNKI